MFPLPQSYGEVLMDPWVLRMIYLFEGLPELSSRCHAQLLCDVSWNFEQENLHEAGHQPILENRKEGF